MNEAELLQILIPYRMQAVDTLNYALRLRSSWSDAPSMTIQLDGKQVMEGHLTAFANPAIEAGLVHCRALLEFLGLCEKDGRLSNRKNGGQGMSGLSISGTPTDRSRWSILKGPADGLSPHE